MATYILSCCSTADLTPEHFAARQISYICFHYMIDGKPYLDDLGQSMPFDRFYQAMAQGAETTTSQVSLQEYIDYFEPFLQQGKDILHVTLSSGLSGTINSAQAARQQLLERYPRRRIFIVDSLGASSGYGLLMDQLAALREWGMGIEQAAQWAEEYRLNLHHWFFSTDLTYYVKGGRISKASGWFGTLLNICPLMNMDEQGKLIPRYKIRGKSQVIREIVEMMKQHAMDGLNYRGKCYISHSDCLEDAQAVAQLVEQTFPKMMGQVEIHSVGTTIGSHTGPGTVALFFWGDRRQE